MSGLPDSANPYDILDFATENEDAEWPQFAAEARALLERGE